MALVYGAAKDIVDVAGRTTDLAIHEDGEDPSVMTFTARADASATSPCWSATLPAFRGYIDRISVQPVTGFMPTSTFTLTITDAYGSSWAYSAIPTAGDTNLLDNSSRRDAFHGPLTLDIDDMGARMRVEIAIFIGSQAIGPAAYAQPSVLRVGDAGGDYIEIDPANKIINVQGAASPLGITDLNMDIWRPPQSGEFTMGLVNTPTSAAWAIGADYLYGIPIVLPWQATYSDIAIRCTTGNAGANARVGLYADDGSGDPGALIEEASAFTPTAAAYYEASFAANRTIGPGYFWLALTTDDNVVEFSASGLGTARSVALIESANLHKVVQYVWASRVYAALPSTFPATDRTTVGSNPRLVLKVA